MRTSSRLTIWLAFLVFSLWSAEAFACKCDKSVKPVSGSKMVFWGKAKEIKSRGAQDRVEFEVTQLYKGDEREAVSVYTNRFHHDCGIRFEVDKTYMVYAYDFYPRGVATSICWGTYEAAEPVAEEAWTKVDVKIPEDTEVEEKLRDIGKSLVEKCGAKYRVYDAGFSMIASPNGDPVRPKVKRSRAREKLQNFRDCVNDAFLHEEELPRPKQSVQLEGWYQRDVKALPVLLDQLPCGDDCPDWENRVKSALLRTTLPDSDDQTTVNIRTEYNECLSGGISSVGGESHGAPAFKRQRDRMLADCAAARGEFEYIDPYLESVENDTLIAALKWGRKTAPAPENKPAQKPTGAPDAGTDAGLDRANFASGSTGAGRATKVYPLTKQGEWSFTKAAIRSEEPKAGDYRVLRSHFLLDDTWYQSPLYLEAFAQAVLADESTTPTMRDLAALALHRAGKLSGADYSSLTASASGSAEATALREELDKAWAAAFKPPEEEVEEVIDEVEEVEEVVAEEPEEDRSMLLIVAGVLIVVALLGIGAILKRRK